jgi:hypothetical protein
MKDESLAAHQYQGLYIRHTGSSGPLNEVQHAAMEQTTDDRRPLKYRMQQQ